MVLGAWHLITYVFRSITKRTCLFEQWLMALYISFVHPHRSLLDITMMGLLV